MPIDPYRSSPFLVNIVAFVRQVTEPILAPLRKVIPPISMGAGALDLSPIVTLIILNMIRRILLGML